MKMKKAFRSSIAVLLMAVMVTVFTCPVVMAAEANITTNEEIQPRVSHIGYVQVDGEIKEGRVYSVKLEDTCSKFDYKIDGGTKDLVIIKIYNDQGDFRQCTLVANGNWRTYTFGSKISSGWWDVEITLIQASPKNMYLMFYK